MAGTPTRAADTLRIDGALLLLLQSLLQPRAVSLPAIPAGIAIAHIAAALRHQFWLGDEVLVRILASGERTISCRSQTHAGDRK